MALVEAERALEHWATDVDSLEGQGAVIWRTAQVFHKKDFPTCGHNCASWTLGSCSVEAVQIPQWLCFIYSAGSATIPRNEQAQRVRVAGDLQRVLCTLHTQKSCLSVP